MRRSSLLALLLATTPFAGHAQQTFNPSTSGPSTITAGCGLTGGGSSGTVTLNVGGIASYGGSGTWTIAAGTYIGFTAGSTLSAPITAQLPSAAAQLCPLTLIDKAGIVNGSNVINITRAGSDTINGSASAQVLGVQFCSYELVSDGVSNWAVKFNSCLAPKTCSASQWVNGIQVNATSCSQPATTNLSDVSSGTWTPADCSGAGLTFTSVNASYTKIGNMVYAYVALTYPSTANASQACISGLPVAVPNQTYAQSPAIFLGAPAGTNAAFVPQANTSQGVVESLAAAVVTNLTLSLKAVSFIAVYPAS